ncbi:MAG: protein translocase subunit SecD, partial [Candidatus Paceibacteria bacterium]
MDIIYKAQKRKALFIASVIVIVTLLGGFFDYPRAWSFLAGRIGLPDFPSKPYQLGLDIAGGTSLTYRADVSSIPQKDQQEAMEGLRDVVERRVNLFGVKEPRVEVAKSPEEWRLIVELAGVKDI